MSVDLYQFTKLINLSIYVVSETFMTTIKGLLISPEFLNFAVAEFTATAGK